MNLILLFPKDIIPGTGRVRLTGRRQAHVLEIHRACLGDRLVVGMENGKTGQGCVTRLTSDELEMDVVFNAAPPPKIPVVLCVAMMRPIVFKRVLQTAAAMGVEAVHVFHSRQVEKSFWQSTALQPEEVFEQLVLGLEQAKDTVVPSVSFHKQFKPFVEDALPGLLVGRQGVVADPSGAVLLPERSPKVLIIGPEGGFIPYEIEKFSEAGCIVFGLGPRILRVETAVTSLLSLLS
ncbi:MAG: 16S rRNA (uracil(1498)-N(3))-methyltransferase [Candidatus Omnitrophica bacterium]|nr:16S rRNA (uracil(1498)-N(3))-methyltransferase [Candidatus Omnitrophota bacterium]